MIRLTVRGLLFVPAWLAVLVADRAWPRVQAVGTRPALRRVRQRIGRLPVPLALILFLVPEAISRLGWFASAWMVVRGHAWRALAVYAATKVTAGLLALWLGSAALPVLLRVPSFAALHTRVMDWRHSAAGWMGRRSGGALASAMARVRADRLGVESRADWLRAGSSAATLAPATPSAPTDPSRTG